MMLSETDKKFAEAVHIFQNLPQELRPTQEEELEFYGLYKRAVVGQCDIPKPDFFNILALAKWEAWKKLDSLSMLKAREIYVDQLIKLLERFPDRPDVVELLDTFTKLHLNDNDDTISNKSQAKSNTFRSDSINNDFQMGNLDNQQIEFTTSREINTNNNQNNSININTSMNSINLGSPRLSRNNSSQSTTEEYIINSNRPTTRIRSKTDGSIYNAIPNEISITPVHQEDPSSYLSSALNTPTLNQKTSPLHPTMSPLNPNINMGLNMGMGMNMGMNPNAKIAASTSMSIVMLTRLRDLEIEVNSLNNRLNMLNNLIKNRSKNSLQNWLKFIFRTFGANLIIFLGLLLIMGPSGYEKVFGKLPIWVVKLQARYILNSGSKSTKAICD